MSQRHAIPRRASISPQERRTTSAYPVLRQAMRHTTADVWEEDEKQQERDTRASRIPNSAHRYVATGGRELVLAQQSVRSVQGPKLPHRHTPCSMWE